MFTVFWTIALPCCGYAALKGGREGQWASLTIIINGLLRSQLADLSEGLACMILASGASLGIFWQMAMTTRRWWPLWALAVQLNVAVIDIAHYAMPLSIMLPWIAMGLALLLPIIMAAGIVLDRRSNLRP